MLTSRFFGLPRMPWQHDDKPEKDEKDEKAVARRKAVRRGGKAVEVNAPPSRETR